MIFRCIPISKKQDGCSSKEQPSQPVKEPLISRAARRSRQRVLGAVCKKEHHLLRWCSLERATRLELASRHPTNGNGHSREPCLTSYDFTRCAQVEAASSRGCLQKKKAPSSQMVLFWSGRRGSNSLPGIPRMAMAIRGSPALPRMISRAARRSRQPVLGAVCKKRKHHLLRWCFSGAGDEARTRYLDLGKVALYQMSYARKRKIDYNPAGGICQPLRSAFFSFFSG